MFLSSILNWSKERKQFVCEASFMNGVYFYVYTARTFWFCIHHGSEINGMMWVRAELDPIN